MGEVCFLAFAYAPVKSLDIAGQSGLRDALSVVRLAKVGSDYHAYVDLGEGEFEVNHPGPFHTMAVEIIEPSLSLEPVPETLTDQELEIGKLKEDGVSNAKICEAIFGYKSSNKYPEIDAAWEKYQAVHGAQA